MLFEGMRQGALVLAVFVQDGVPVLIGEGCLYISEVCLTTS